VAAALLEHEVLDAPQLRQLLAGEPLEMPAPQKPAAPPREVRVEEGSRPAGLLPPIADPRPTS
jgi:hypothetical protein